MTYIDLCLDARTTDDMSMHPYVGKTPVKMRRVREAESAQHVRAVHHRVILKDLLELLQLGRRDGLAVQHGEIAAAQIVCQPAERNPDADRAHRVWKYIGKTQGEPEKSNARTARFPWRLIHRKNPAAAGAADVGAAAIDAGC